MEKIAVDVEGVLADSQSKAEDVIPDEEMKEWGFSTEEYLNLFMERLSTAWQDEWKSISEVNPDNKYAVNILNNFYQVDIVTARIDSDEEIKNWLDMHNIKYNDFISTKTYKEQLNYDYYIDDNPHMVNKGIDLFFYDQSWNKSSDANKRVESVSEVAAYLIETKN